MADERGDEVVEIELNGYQAIKKGKTQVDRDGAATDAAPATYRANSSSKWWLQCFECLKLSNKAQFVPIQGNENEAVHNQMKHQPGSLLRDNTASENPSGSLLRDNTASENPSYGSR